MRNDDLHGRYNKKKPNDEDSDERRLLEESRATREHCVKSKRVDVEQLMEGNCGEQIDRRQRVYLAEWS